MFRFDLLGIEGRNDFRDFIRALGRAGGCDDNARVDRSELELRLQRLCFRRG